MHKIPHMKWRRVVSQGKEIVTQGMLAKYLWTDVLKNPRRRFLIRRPSSAFQTSSPHQIDKIVRLNRIEIVARLDIMQIWLLWFASKAKKCYAINKGVRGRRDKRDGRDKFDVAIPHILILSRKDWFKINLSFIQLSRILEDNSWI